MLLSASRLLFSGMHSACSTDSSAAAARSLRIIKSVAGLDNRSNDVIYVPPASNDSSDRLMVYFGGDVQDFEEKMVRYDSAEDRRTNSDSACFFQCSLMAGST
jgi:hypothetical protein